MAPLSSLSQCDVTSEVMEAAASPWHVADQQNLQNVPRSWGHHRRGCVRSCHQVGPAGSLPTGTPERDRAGVEADSGRASTGPAWSSSSTSDLFFLQEQIRATWQLLLLIMAIFDSEHLPSNPCFKNVLLYK